ncbi:MAG: L-threonylcarbamoyladenylate synthase [Neisseria sp.]|nr:L-threonylcarbamoyladenylate synthase [Neisseria sp.]
MPRLNVPPARLKAHLKRGGLIAYPTESSYGLGCLPQHKRALNQLIKMKKRPQHKGLIVIADRLCRLKNTGANRAKKLLHTLGEADEGRLKNEWPARKTFLLPAAPHVLPQLRGRNRRKLAVRIPDHALARQVCQSAGSALVSTSCNRARQRPCRTEREVKRQFGRKVLVIGGRTGGAKTPSAIIDFESGEKLR